uniref:Protein phosphatase 1 regulatory inhibitor subunit 1C n=1 Tax=Corvus moneduloides TaxID=1196302 RepID=A0A8U7MGN0_CORMO
MEPNSPKKIQFAVPLFQSQIDPEAAEQIRKRRPTPASLVIMNEHMPPEKDEKRTNISQAESQSASPKQRKQSVFTPPALKGTVQVLPCPCAGSVAPLAGAGGAGAVAVPTGGPAAPGPCPGTAAFPRRSHCLALTPSLGLTISLSSAQSLAAVANLCV